MLLNAKMIIAKTIIKNLKPSTSTTPEINEGIRPSRVDINNLLDRARKVKSDERRTSLIYASLFFLVILIVGILLSF